MPEPYENIYIGTFILGLGYRLGRRSGETDTMASVNLYQQTPGDPLFGDLLSTLEGKSTIIEFKRSIRQLHLEVSKKSEAKSDIFSIIWESSNEFTPELIEISRQCHFAGFGVSDDQNCPDINFIPYSEIEVFLRQNSQITENNLNTFQDRLIAGEIGSDHDEFIKYLSYLQSNSKGGGIPMLIVNLSPKNKITILPVETVEVALKLQQMAPDEKLPQKGVAPPQETNPVRVRA